MTLTELYERAEKRGIEVDFFPMRELAAFSLPNGWIAMDRGKISGTREEKVVLAHEMGHVETCSFYNNFSPLDIRGKHERRADKWACMEIVPRDEFDQAVASGLTEVWELAEYFDVPCEFMEKAMILYHEMDLAI